MTCEFILLCRRRDDRALHRAQRGNSKQNPINRYLIKKRSMICEPLIGTEFLQFRSVEDSIFKLKGHIFKGKNERFCNFLTDLRAKFARKPLSSPFFLFFLHPFFSFLFFSQGHTL